MDDIIYTRLNDKIRRLAPVQLVVLEEYLAKLASETPNLIPGGLTPSNSTIARKDGHNNKSWPHAPQHRISEHGTYLVTAGTLHKEHFCSTVQRLDFLQEKLIESAEFFGWHLEAWAVFSNHYHFVGHSKEGSAPLNNFLGHLHSAVGAFVNELGGISRRQVWHNYWETRLTYEKSYLARLNYVHQNPVKHGLVRMANQYRWSSAAWLERTATPAQVKTIYSFKIDRLRVLDDYDVLAVAQQGR